MPSRFPRQFGYDQLYVNNPNIGLRFSINLFESIRAWYYSVVEGTGAVFGLSHKMPNCYTSLSFCTWYFIASRVPNFGMNISYIKSIKASYKMKSGSQSRIRGMSECMEAEREAKKEARKETGRTKTASGSESGAGAVEEQPTRRTRHAVPKRPRASTSQGEPS